MLGRRGQHRSCVGRSTLGDDLGELLEQQMPRQRSMAGRPVAPCIQSLKAAVDPGPTSAVLISSLWSCGRIPHTRSWTPPRRGGIHRKQSAPASVAWPASSFRMMVAGDEFAGLAAKPPPDASFKRSILFA